MAASSFRALFQSLFTDDGDGDGDGGSTPSSPSGSSSQRGIRASPPRRRPGSNALPPTAAARLFWGRRQARRNSTSSASSSVTSSISEPLYVAHAADGEFTARFSARPLGMGLVPSTQLYGSWEVSSVSAAVARGANVDYVDGDLDSDKRSINSSSNSSSSALRVARGDVIVALNCSRVKAQLPRQQLAAYLQECALPVVVTLRRPALYAAVDSRSLATAMYPDSIEYEASKAFADQKRFAGRASSAQWKRALRHELAQNALQATRDSTKQLAQTLARGTPDSQSPGSRSAADADQTTSPTSPRSPGALSPRKSPFASPRRPSGAVGVQVVPTTSRSSPKDEVAPRGRAALSPMGEFELAFDEHPLHLVLAPSTRMYGSVEIYDPKTHSVDLQVGDVIMAVNGDPSVSRWGTEDLIDFLAGLFPPVTIRFRRPTAYRQYLERYFKTSKAISSQSVVHSMFPRSAEYKSTPPKSTNRKRLDNSVTLAPPLSASVKPPAKSQQTGAGAHGSAKTTPRGHQQRRQQQQEQQQQQHALASPPSDVLRPKISEMRDFSFRIDATEQFKLWNGGGRDGAAQSSSVLTEKHVRFLWSHLPHSLSCNEMELVYSTRYHGWNLLSFYSKLQDKGPTIMVVQDTRDNIFGAFCATSWQNSQNIYGNGRAFVFTLRPQMKVYPWSGMEGSFMYSRHDALFIGGGARGIALCLQLDDMRGFSRGCDTFDSPPLTERGEFECEICEVWSFSGLRI